MKGMQSAPLSDKIVHAFDGMSKQLQVAARYMLEHPREVALLSMREQARQADIQPATMTRLAKSLGFDGYDDIRQIYADAMRNDGLGFAGRVGQQAKSQKLKGDQSLAADMLGTVGAHVAALAQPAMLGSLADAARYLERARRIHCLGLRSSHSAAWHLHYILTHHGEKHPIMLDAMGGIGVDALGSAMRRDDVLVAVSVLPYTRQTIEITEYAQAHAASALIAITDSPVAPSGPASCRGAVIVPTESPSFLHTMSPAFVVAEILGALVAGRGGEGGGRGAGCAWTGSRRPSTPTQDQRAGVRDPHSAPRHPFDPMPVAVGGRGIELLRRRTGKAYIDASGGAAVSCLGHGHPDVLAALHRQLDSSPTRIPASSPPRRPNTGRPADRRCAPAGMSHAYFVSGGSEAIEAALKMARQYFVEKGEPQRRHIIARRQSYHGNTLGALAAGGNEWRRAQFKPAADRDPPHRPLLRLPPAETRRERRGLRRARRTAARGQDPRAGARSGYCLRRRDGGGGHGRRRAAGWRLSWPHPCHMRPPRRAVDP
jgi:DNA-binding MurR/RpiR family transcriptional regulator